MVAVVLGGLGFIGGAIVRELLGRNTKVIVFDKADPSQPVEQLFDSGKVKFIKGNILDREAVRNCFEGAEEVYHLAAMLGTSELDDDIRSAIDVNIIGSVNVFESAVECHVPAVFYPSKPNVWLNAYSITKFASEQFAHLYGQTSQTRFCSLRYFNAYGPFQSLYPVRKIIPAFAARAMRGVPIEVFGDGLQTVDLIYAGDVARFTVDLLRSGTSGDALDCGRGDGRTVNSVAEDVNHYFGNSAGIDHLPMRRGETPNTQLVADVSPLQQAIGPLSFSPWQPSLGETLSWYAHCDPHEIDEALNLRPLT